MVLCIFCSVAPFSARAWEANIKDKKSMPQGLVVVDKSANRLSYYEKHSPLVLLHEYPSIHGEKEGDKMVEGDLKTPEGVYFITTKIKMQLDFEEYGSQAHALNYPNPIDRLRGKTGGGIWIHSKGSPIKDQTTQGCVAVDLDDIEELGDYLTAGTPVLIAQAVHRSEQISDASFHSRDLQDKDTQVSRTRHTEEALDVTSENNAPASSGSSTGLLDEHERELMTMEESGSMQLDSDIIGLQSSENQESRNAQKDPQVREKTLQYIGAQTNKENTAIHLSNEYVAELSDLISIDDQIRARAQAMQVEKNQLEETDKDLGQESGQLAVDNTKQSNNEAKDIATDTKHTELNAEAQDSAMDPDFGQTQSPDLGRNASRDANTNEQNAQANNESVATELSSNAEEQILLELTKAWNDAWADRSETFFDFYEKDSYSKAQGQSFSKFQDQKEYLFRNMSWLFISYQNINVLEGPGYWVTWFPQYYRAPNHKTEGVRRLYWQKDEQDEYKIVAMEWLPRNLQLDKAFTEHVQNTVPLFVEAWRSAWLNADTAAYKSFYAEDAQQDSLRGIQPIVEKKESIWAVKTPTQIDLINVRVEDRANSIHVYMDQAYADSSGYKDYGVKRLILHPKGSSWEIASEVWSRR